MKGGEEIMIGLDRLMKIKGVLVAGEFTEDGKLIRKTGDLPDDLVGIGAKLCSSQKARSEIFLEFFNGKLNGNWMPYIGSAVWGGNYVIVTMGCTFVIIDAKYADINELMVDLLGCGPTGARQMNQ